MSTPARRWIAFLLFLPLSRPALAQSERLVAHLPLKLVDLAIVADTTRGVQLLAVPAVNTNAGRQDAALIWLRLDPDSVLEWINSAAAVLSVPVAQGPPEGIQWSPVLRGRRGSGSLSLGRERKRGSLGRTRWLAIADSVTGWRADLGGAEADSLLRLMFFAASRSRLDTAAAQQLDPDRVDSPASIVHQPQPGWRGIGRVVMEYLVGENGRADPASVVALLASSPELIPEARLVVLGSRFRPAARNGQPVSQLVVQAIVWRRR